MRGDLRLGTLLGGVLGALLLLTGVIYLSVECQALPGFMGPTHGDTSPRTGLGVLFCALAALAFLGVFFSARPRRGS